MKIRTQLILSIAALVLVFLILTITAVTTTSQEGRYEQQMALIEQTQRDVYALNQLTNDYLFNREDRQKAQWETEYSVISSDLDSLQPMGPEQQALVNTIRNDQQHLWEIYSEVSSMIERMNASGGTPQDEVFISTSWSRMAVQNQEMIGDAYRLAGLIREDSEKVEQASSFLIYGLLGMILLILVMNYLVIYRRVLGSVDELRSGTEVIGSGDLEYRIPEKGDDEFKTLAASFNAMTASRKEAEETLQQKTVDLEMAYEEIAASEEELRKNYEELARSQQALEESEKRLRRFYDSGLIGVIYWTTDGKILDANDTFLSMTGYTRTDLEAGKIDWAGMTPPECHSRDVASLAELKRDGRNRVPFEKEYIRKDGSRVPVLVAGAMLDETRTRGVAFALDITERKDAKEAREEYARQRQLALDAARLGWWYYNPLTGISTYDTRYQEIFGVSGHERPNDEILLLLHPDDRPTVWAAVQAALDPGDPKPYAIEYRVNAADGVMRWVRAYGIASFEGSGDDRHAVSFVGTVEDITESKAIEQVLRESEERFREIFNNANDGIELIEMNDDGSIGRFIEVNEVTCRLVQYSREELLAMGPFDLNTGEFTPPLQEVMRALKEAGHATFETEHRRKDGTIFPVEISSHSVSWKDKNALISVVRDITERKAAEETIHVMNLKLALMNDVTYQDIQNKVTAVRGFMDLYNRVPGEEEQQKIAGKIATVLGSIQALIQKTKEYQRMGIAKSQWIDVEHVVRSDFSDISDTHTVVLETDLHGLRLNTDPLIHRVFYNLLHNAIAHGKTATRIRITTRETGDGLKLEFEDDGVGVPPEAKSSIFDRVVAGEGKFGLFFVRQFLSISGMTIIENGEPGKGARFVITIPHGMYRFSS